MYINPILRTTIVPQNYKNNKNIFNCSTKLSFGSDYFDYNERLKEKLNSRSKWQKFWGTGKKKAEQAVNSELIGFNIHQGLLVKKVEDSIKDKEALLKQKEETITAEYKALRASNTMEEDYTYGLQGTITIDDKQYTFKWTNNHINPCLSSIVIVPCSP